MAMSADFCDERADEAAAQAKAATLDNLRDQALRSEKVWRSMAERARETERSRALAVRATAHIASQEP